MSYMIENETVLTVVLQTMWLQHLLFHGGLSAYIYEKCWYFEMLEVNARQLLETFYQGITSPL